MCCKFGNRVLCQEGIYGMFFFFRLGYWDIRILTEYMFGTRFSDLRRVFVEILTQSNRFYFSTSPNQSGYSYFKQNVWCNQITLCLFSDFKH